MSERFLIRHADGREYELDDVAFFLREYQPQGFEIVQSPPTGYSVPALPDDVAVTTDEATGEVEIDLAKMTRAELDAYAESLGIAEVSQYPNKDAVIEAIHALGDESESGEDVQP